MQEKINFSEIKNMHRRFVTEKVKNNFWDDRFKDN